MAFDNVFSDRSNPRSQMARTLAPRAPSVRAPAQSSRAPQVPRPTQPRPTYPQTTRPAAAAPQQSYSTQSRATYAGPQTGAATQPQAPSQPQGAGYAYQADPVIQRIQALAGMNAANARSDAEASRKQVLLDYGDPEFAKSIYSQQGSPIDETFLKSVGDNSFGITQQLKRSREQETASAEDRLNKANLHYSGARGKQLGELGTQHLQRENDAQGQVREWLRQILASQLAAEAEAAASYGAYGEGGGYPSGPYGDAPPADAGPPAPPPPYNDWLDPEPAYVPQAPTARGPRSTFRPAARGPFGRSF